MPLLRNRSLQVPLAYEYKGTIDEGAYGCVMLCVQQPSGFRVAVKKCKFHTDPSVRRLLQRELRVLQGEHSTKRDGGRAAPHGFATDDKCGPCHAWVWPPR